MLIQDFLTPAWKFDTGTACGAGDKLVSRPLDDLCHWYLGFCDDPDTRERHGTAMYKLMTGPSDNLTSYMIWLYHLFTQESVMQTSRARCPMSSTGPSLSYSGSADSSFSKRQSERSIFASNWKDIEVFSQVHANWGSN